jgi:hypothetical protein
MWVRREDKRYGQETPPFLLGCTSFAQLIFANVTSSMPDCFSHLSSPGCTTAAAPPRLAVAAAAAVFFIPAAAIAAAAARLALTSRVLLFLMSMTSSNIISARLVKPLGPTAAALL